MALPSHTTIYNYSQLLHSVVNALYTQYVCDGSFLYVLVFALRIDFFSVIQAEPQYQSKAS